MTAAAPQPARLCAFVGAPAVWTFPVDVGLRRRLFVSDVFSHPAKLHLGLLQKLIDVYTYPGDTILDPMAGTGSLMIAATQQRNVILRDLQSEYVAMMQSSVAAVHRYAGLFGGLIDIDTADAKTLNCPPFDHVIFSPPYGFQARTSSTIEVRLKRLKDMDADPRWLRKFTNMSSDHFCYAGGNENSGNKSGESYWQDMRLIYSSIIRLLPSGGCLILILKNHIRAGQLIDIVARTVDEVQALGPGLVAKHGRLVHPLSLWQRRRKEQGQPIVEVEDVLVFRK